MSDFISGYQDSDLFLLLFACCIPVKGAKRSILCDTQRNTFKLIPNDMYDFISTCASERLRNVYKGYDVSTFNVLDEYISLVMDEEFGFLTEAPEKFPKVDLNFITPEEISDSIIDLNEDSNYDIKKILCELEILGCKSVQFRFFGNHSIDYIKNVLTHLDDQSFNTVEIVLSISKQVIKDDLVDILKTNFRVYAIYAFNSDVEEIVYVQSNVTKSLVLINQPDFEVNDCGCISPAYFVTNLKHLMESKSYNNCLNKKISIDYNGLIKNCPSMGQDYGHISTSSLIEIYQLRQFQKYWKLKKDDVKVCQDCEFRYICSDCRVFTENNDILGKPQKCNYDPYTAQWL